MAKKKQYFGEAIKTETKTPRKTERKTKKTAAATPIKRKYPKRAKTVRDDIVMIPVPASLAFQIGLTLGHQFS